MANLRANNLTGSDGRNAIDGSVFFEGESSYLEMASGALISGTGFGTNDFTIEFWINQGVNASNYTILFAYTSSTNLDRFEVAMHSSTIQVYTHTGAWRDTGYAPVSGQWEHIAFVRNYSGNTLKMYANGVEKWSVSNNHDYNEAGVTQIGSYGSASYGYFEGFISNLRVVNGTALYTANFTPPTEKLTVVPNTVLLCCQDSDNALQEATGKTITGYGRHPSAAYDGNGEGPELVTSTGVWTLACGGGGCSNFTVTNNGQTLSGTTVTSGYIRATYTGLDSRRRYRIKVTHTAGSNNNFSVQGDNTGYRDATDGTAGTALQVGSQYVFEWSGSTTVVITGSAWNKLYTIDNISIKQIPNSPAPKILPSVGVDHGLIFDGDIKINSPNYMYFPTGDTSQRGRGRGLFFGGYAPSPNSLRNIIDYIQIQSAGNAIDFGDLLAINNGEGGNCSSSTRGLAGGGMSNIVDITYVTIATTSNALDFGDLLTGRRSLTAVSNDTRGLFAGGTTPTMKNEIEYVTVATKGDALDFGDLAEARRNLVPNASPTRGVFAGGNPGSSPLYTDRIDYVTIASAGNATDFGDMVTAMREQAGSSSSTRGLIAGGFTSPAHLDTIEYITIATLGNALDYGDLHTGRSGMSGTSNGTRGIFAGGSYINNIQYVTITTTGNAKDFGDLTLGRMLYGAASDSHGGIE